MHKASILTTLLYIAWAVEPKSLPIRRSTKGGRIKDDAWRKNNRALVSKKFNKGSSSSSSSSSKRATTGSSTLEDANADTAYYTSISIGTPPVSYNIILDTGSSDLWLQDAQPTGQDAQSVQTLYSPTGSSTFNSTGSQPFTIQYLGGDVSGNTARETVSMAGFTVSGQQFGVIDNPGSGTIPPVCSGLMGLAWPPIAQLGTPWWQNAETTTGWTQPLFAFQLARDDTETNAEESDLPGGSFTLGEVDTSLYKGDIEYINIPSGEASWWLLDITEVTVNGQAYPLSGATAAIDTGTSLIGGPQDATDTIYSNIQGAQPGTGANDGYYFYPCSTELNVTFSFGGQAWSIDPSDFSSPTNDPETCMGAIFAAESGSGQSSGSGQGGTASISPGWVMGDTFLKNVYSVYRYDPPSVGFAALASGNETPFTTPTGTAGAQTTATIHHFTVTQATGTSQPFFTSGPFGSGASSLAPASGLVTMLAMAGTAMVLGAAKVLL